MLVIPSVSDRGEARLRVEASAPHSSVCKKKWFAVYTAARHEKYVQAQLKAKQIQSFLPLYTTRAALEKRGSAGDPVSALSGLCLCLRRCERAASGSSDHRRCLYCGQPHSTIASRRSGDARTPYRSQRASLSPYPLPAPGDTVYIKHGPFQGVKGHVQRDRGNLTFVVTIQLIQRSFAIGVQACDLELAG